MKYWKRLSHEQVKEIVFEKIQENVNYREEGIIGVPGSYLDTKVFYDNASFLSDAPYLYTLIQNPNHIGCHTMGESEDFFAGTQALERDLIKLCAEDIFKGEPEAQDGYVASGGTEANIQALWIYRNYFIKEFGAKASEIAILTSEDSHYSIPKGGNLLGLDVLVIPVDFSSRRIKQDILEGVIQKEKAKGRKYFVAIANMGTTMFGSVDQPEDYTDVLDRQNVSYKLHVDAAFGGFIYPISNENCTINFQHPKVNSITMDAHKMAQAPYGTGIFLIRKGYMQYVYTEEAQYVSGLDLTLVGSRSGANAVSVWMILMNYGYYGWKEKIDTLLNRTNWLCNQLDQLGIRYFKEPFMNIVTIESDFLTDEVARKYALVPDSHDASKRKWLKIVCMEHVLLDTLVLFIDELKALQKAAI